MDGPWKHELQKDVRKSPASFSLAAGIYTSAPAQLHLRSVPGRSPGSACNSRFSSALFRRSQKNVSLARRMLCSPSKAGETAGPRGARLRAGARTPPAPAARRCRGRLSLSPRPPLSRRRAALRQHPLVEPGSPAPPGCPGPAPGRAPAPAPPQPPAPPEMTIESSSAYAVRSHLGFVSFAYPLLPELPPCSAGPAACRSSKHPPPTPTCSAERGSSS